jgi:hypothetical protein
MEREEAAMELIRAAASDHVYNSPASASALCGVVAGRNADFLDHLRVRHVDDGAGKRFGVVNPVHLDVVGGVALPVYAIEAGAAWIFTRRSCLLRRRNPLNGRREESL